MNKNALGHLDQMIVGQFEKADNGQKATMLASMPKRLLAVGGEIYRNLGDNPEVWFEYIRAAGPDIVGEMPYPDRRDFILPLISEANTVPFFEIWPLLIAARVFVDENVALLMQFYNGDLSRHGLDDHSLWVMTSRLKPAKELILPITLELLRSPVKRKFAFHTLDVTEWQYPPSVEEVAIATFDALKESTDFAFISAAAYLLAKAAPQLLLRYAVQVMRSVPQGKPFITHPLHSVQETVVGAFDNPNVAKSIKTDLIFATIKAKYIWRDWDLWQVLLLVAYTQSGSWYLELITALNGDDTKKLLRTVPTLSAENLTALADAGELLLQEVIKTQNQNQLVLDFLEKMRNFFYDETVVGFVTYYTGIYNINTLTLDYSYPHSGNTQLAELLPTLIGSAKAHAAIELLRRLFYKTNSPIKSATNPELVAALDALVVVFCTGPSISGASEAAGILQQLDLEMWSTHLDRILTNGAPFWRAKFALITLELDPEHQLAAATVAEMMTCNDKDVKWILRENLA